MMLRRITRYSLTGIVVSASVATMINRLYNTISSESLKVRRFGIAFGMQRSEAQILSARLFINLVETRVSISRRRQLLA